MYSLNLYLNYTKKQEVIMVNKVKKIRKNIGLSEDIFEQVETFKNENYLTYSEAIEALVELGLENREMLKRMLKELKKKAEEALERTANDKTIERISISIKEVKHG
jgi:Arc/MetJ-type ribon-helix-helix transcriptional regulator